MMVMLAFFFVLDHHAKLDCYIANSLKL